MNNELGLFDGFSIQPVKDDSGRSNLTKLMLDSNAKMQISSLVQNLPTGIIASGSSNLYMIKFPKGVTGELTKLKQGGFGTMLKNLETGQFTGSASMYKFRSALLGSLTAMSLATGQYFLTEINKHLRLIDMKLDKILEFLYGEKKAELLAEIHFTRYAYQNFTSIAGHEAQCTATIASLQEAKKVAMKDIEFYINDLESTVNADVKLGNTLNDTVSKTFQIHESIDLSVQLYAVSSLLEAFYSQNTDVSYVSFLEEELSSYIEKCDKRTLASFSILRRRVDDFKDFAPIKGKLNKTAITQKIDEQIEILHNEGSSEKHKEIREAIRSIGKPAEYIISEDGELYFRNPAA